MAAEVAFSVGAYYYLDTEYPVSTRLIQRNLDSPSVTASFKVVEAKKAGYSNREIAEYLAKENAEKKLEYLKHIAIVEITLFVVALLAGIGIVVLKVNSTKNN